MSGVRVRFPTIPQDLGKAGSWVSVANFTPIRTEVASTG